MEAFRSMLEECHMMDMGYSRPWYTWSHGKFMETRVRERLDRCVACADWVSLFPNVVGQHLPRTISDHRLILVRFNQSIVGGHNKVFRFEA